MLAVTADIFSGRENPRWVLVDENEARDVLRKAARHRQALAPPEQVRPVLGFRGLVVELLDDSAAQRLDLPSEFLLAGGTTVPVNNSFFALIGNGRFLSVPYIVLITAVFVLIMHYVLSQTRFGQHNYAIGANVQAARRAGIDIKAHLLRLYILSAGCAGLAGVLYSARFNAGAAQAGEPLLLDCVAAVVIGGASLFGGSGTILGTVAGAFVIAVIQYGLVFVNVEPFWQFISVGVVIIISVLIDQAQRRFSGGRVDE